MASDENLMAAVAGGSEQAFCELLRRYERALAGYLRRQAGAADAAETEDLFQEVWLRVVRSSGTFDRTARFKPWFYRIALNVVRDWWNRRSARGEEVTADLAGEPRAREEATVEIERLLATLPREQREVVMLKYYVDLSEADIGEALQIPRGTVKSRLHAAMSRLESLAKPEGEKR